MEKRNFYLLSCGKWLSKKAFLNYFEKKVLRTIRKFKLIKEKGKIGIGVSGGKDSMTLLYILNKFFKGRIVALAVDEGIPGYREKLLLNAKKFCKKEDIPLEILYFEKEFGFKLKDKIKKIKKLGLTNCYVCSILKRWLINKAAFQLGCNVVATAHSLDDEAENILLNLFKGNPNLLAKLGPKTGIEEVEGFIQRIKPFYFCRTKEIILYGKAHGIPVKEAICPLRGETLRVSIRKWLGQLEKKHVEIKNAIVSSFLKISPLLKEKARTKQFKVKKCEKCGFPSSRKICKACEILELLNIA